MSCVLLLDVGGTFLKGALVSTADSSVVTSIRRAGPPLKLSRQGEATLDPLVLQEELASLARELASGCDSKLIGVFVTGQMHGVVLTDGNGRPATDVITWRDSLQSRSGEHSISADQFIRDTIDPSRISALGNELREGLPIATLASRRSRGLQVRGLVAHSLISYAAASLIRFKEKPRMHVTDAAAHGLLRVEENSWDPEVLTALDLTGLQLPEVTVEIEPIGWSDEFNCDVYVAVGDQQAALLGMNLAEGELSLNIATGSQVSTLTRKPHQTAQVRPYFGDLYLSTFTHIPAGRALNVLVQLVTELSPVPTDDAWIAISKKVKDEHESELEIDLAFFPSLVGSSGKISNIREGNLTVGQLFKASVQAMSKHYLGFATQLFPLRNYTSVVLSGGLATRFPPLFEAIRSEFGEVVYRVSSAEDSSLDGLRQLSLRALKR